ncbi:Uncharacterised protein [Bordetella pertussis]|nr:Uncharacterised protein [Bordetella pertussis]CFW30584.1 Uncharacterised protein [Bordetella pertussis]
MVGGRKPAIMFSSVLLPQPDGPTMATNSPSSMRRLTSPTACTVALRAW